MRDLKKFIVLKKQLATERETLITRLAELNEALGLLHEPPSNPVNGESRSEKSKVIRRARTKIKNPMSLRAAVKDVTKAKALTKKEILVEVGKLGYKFSASDPTNSLNTILYGKPKFKNKDGKFSAP